MPPTTGHWGRLIATTRLATGLVLFFYVLTHNLNHALGLVSLDAMEAGRLVFLAFWRFKPIEAALLLASGPPSPCISVCQIDPATGWCIGCRRSIDEIRDWIISTPEERQKILDALPARRAGGK